MCFLFVCFPIALLLFKMYVSAPNSYRISCVWCEFLARSDTYAYLRTTCVWRCLKYPLNGHILRTTSAWAQYSLFIFSIKPFLHCSLEPYSVHYAYMLHISLLFPLSRSRSVSSYQLDKRDSATWTTDLWHYLHVELTVFVCLSS